MTDLDPAALQANVTRVTWNGHVVEIGETTFHAHLLGDDTDEWEIAEIPLERLSDEDRDILQEGSYLTMTVTGESFAVSVKRIYLTQADIDRAEEEAKILAASLNWIDDNN